MSKIIDSLVDETEEFLSDKKLARRQRCFDSNLNRLSHWMETKEIAAITAWRGALETVLLRGYFESRAVYGYGVE